MTREERRKAHFAINNLSHFTVGTIVRQQFPEASPEEINALARKVISAAHAKISPKPSAKRTNQ